MLDAISSMFPHKGHNKELWHQLKNYPGALINRLCLSLFFTILRAPIITMWDSPTMPRKKPLEILGVNDLIMTILNFYLVVYHCTLTASIISTMHECTPRPTMVSKNVPFHQTQSHRHKATDNPEEPARPDDLTSLQ